MPIVKVENVSYSYDKKTDVLKNINLEIEKGEYVCIVGHNGSGKSTLAKLFNGLLIPDSGEITACGYSSKNKKSLFEIRKRVGVVFQNPDNQLVASIVEDDIAFGPENLGIKREEIKQRIDFALSAVGMEEYKNSSPERLSGGQKQRIAIAGVLALKPEVIILDEATSMLDPRGRKEVLDVVKKLNENGTTVIAITHYMEETIEADRIYVLKDGEVINKGTPREVFGKKDLLFIAGLELPPATKIAEELKKKGANINGDLLTPEELAEELCKL